MRKANFLLSLSVSAFAISSAFVPSLGSYINSGSSNESKNQNFIIDNGTTGESSSNLNIDISNNDSNNINTNNVTNSNSSSNDSNTNVDAKDNLSNVDIESNDTNNIDESNTTNKSNTTNNVDESNTINNNSNLMDDNKTTTVDTKNNSSNINKNDDSKTTISNTNNKNNNVVSNRIIYIEKYPKSDTYSPTLYTKFLGIKNSTDLDSYLKKLFTDAKNFENLEKYSEYNHVSLSYLDNSANFIYCSFKLRLTADEGYIFRGGSKTKDITVNLNLIKTAPTARSPEKNDSWRGRVDKSVEGITDEKSFYNFLVKTMKVDTITGVIYNTSNLKLWFDYLNVNLYLHSTNLEDSFFTIRVKPKNSYTWRDGTTVSKYITVKMDLYQTSEVYMPSSWSLDALADQWADTDWWFRPYFWNHDQGYLNDFAFLSQVTSKDMINSYGEAIKSVEWARNYPSDMVQVIEGTWSYFWVKVTLDTNKGRWSDGTQSTYKFTRVNVFSSYWKYITNDPDSIFTNVAGNWWYPKCYGKEDFAQTALLRYYVDIRRLWNSTFITYPKTEFAGKTYDEIHKYMENKILNDIIPFFPNWNISISALVSSGTKPRITDSTWVYDVHYEHKYLKNEDNETLRFNTRGFAFTTYW